MKQIQNLMAGFEKFKFFWLLSPIIVLALGCTPVPDYGADDEVVTITLHDKSEDFATFKTYALSDTVSVLSSSDPVQKVVGGQSSLVISNIQSNMTARGFTQVGFDKNPDMVINVFAIKNVNVATYYPGYWYGYGGYYPYYGYGGGYYYYYPWSYTYTYTTGSVMVEMVDFKNKKPGSNKITVMWSCFINGYVDASVNATTINQYVNQGFKQSPYIQSGN